MSELIQFSIINGTHGDIGKITLNNPKSLNALNIEMIDAIQNALDECENNQNIKAVFIDSNSEKAFCAGGDVIGLYNSMKETAEGEIPQMAMEFFRKEYHQDYRLHIFPKPVIAWGNGIVMGGGIGVMSACSHRIVTEKSMLAMPEVTIGLYPDVAASWFFNRMPANIGMFLGITGARMNASDAIYCKLADFFVLDEYKDEFITELSEVDWKNPNCDIQNALESLMDFSRDDTPLSNLQENYKQIQYLFRHCDLEKSVKELKEMQPKTKWLELTQKAFLKGCPVTYKLVDEQIIRAKYLSLKEVFEMEFIMSTRCAMNPDLQEGIRALLVDKDGNPQWTVNSVAEISNEQTELFFTAPWSEGKNLFN